MVELLNFYSYSSWSGLDLLNKKWPGTFYAGPEIFPMEVPRDNFVCGGLGGGAYPIYGNVT